MAEVSKDLIKTVKLEVVEIAKLADGQAENIYDVLAIEIGDSFSNLQKVEEELAELEAAEEPDEVAIKEKAKECEDIAAELAEIIKEGRIIAECLGYNLEVLAGDLNEKYDIV